MGKIIRDNIIELHNITYCYPNRETPVLKNISFSVDKGKFVAIMGHTGAGKTTLNLCLNGLIPQLLEGVLTGQISINKQDLSHCSVPAIAKQIGLVLDDPETQIIGRTVKEDVAFGPANLSLSVEEIYDRVEEALKLVQLEGFEQRDTTELSGGEKQRLAIADILAMLPEILVLDEPASELDPAGRQEIYQTIAELRNREQRTILVTEHNCEEIIGRADEVKVLLEGELVWEGQPTDLFRNIPLLDRFRIRPLPVSLLGWEFYHRGWIPFSQVPLDVSAAVDLIGSLLPKLNPLHALPVRGKRKFTHHVDTESSLMSPSCPGIIEVNEVSHQYGQGNTALKSVNLTVCEGEFIALIGKNGSGKTTLAKHLNGLLKPSSGSVTVYGRDTRNYDTSQLAQQVGYVFQNPDHQLFCASVEQELEYGLKSSGLEDSEISRRIDEVLDFTGLGPVRSEHPLSFGKGERQLIAVASILVLKPRILVIDEPTTGLDWAGTQQLLALIQKLHQNGTTIIMISHDMELVARHAQRLVVMKDGGILLDGPSREVFSQTGVLEQAGIVSPQCVRLSHGLKAWGLEEVFLDEEELLQALLPERENC